MTAQMGAGGDLDGADALELAADRATGRFELDQWGFDPSLCAALDPLARLRWRIDVVAAAPGAPVLPARGPAMVLHRRGVGPSDAAVVAAGLHRATGRLVRVVGAPDVAPLGWWMRRVGAVGGSEGEVRGLLRAGEVVAVPLSRSVGRRGGEAPTDLVAVALALGVPVIPVALRGHELGRRWRLRVAEPITGPAAGAADVEALCRRVGARIDELAG